MTADDPLLRACGETPRGSHGGHRYMLDATVYVCPGGYVLHDIRAGIEDIRQRYGSDRAEPSDYSDGGHAEPSPPQTAEEQVRDLEHILQRVREVVGTDQPLNEWFHRAGYASEARVAVAEWEANAYRNQVQALIREMQRMARNSDVGEFAVIVMDGRSAPDADADPTLLVSEQLAALALDTLGIDLTDGQPVPAFALDNACRQLAKSEAARQRLRDDIKAMSRQLGEAFGIGDGQAIDALGSAVAQLADARMWARHGYEIGQRHCGWSDHGVAPAWLTEGWPPHFDSCEHLKQAAEYDTALSRVRGLSERPEAVDPSKPYSDDYLLGYRMAISTAKSVASNEPATGRDGADG